jgi:hypothetical protein
VEVAMAVVHSATAEAEAEAATAEAEAEVVYSTAVQVAAVA